MLELVVQSEEAEEEVRVTDNKYITSGKEKRITITTGNYY